MSDMKIELELHSHGVDLINSRYPRGWGGAAALRTVTGRILTSVAPEAENDALSLCMEVGACLEAHKFNENITHSLCVYRESEKSECVVLSPCGICSERLSYWGGDLLVAISNPENKLIFKPLRELLPHHWSQVNGKTL